MNVLNIKEKDILQFLIKNKERFVTSKELELAQIIIYLR
ncbi:transcriptional regulator [Streptococcus pneumoniae]|nr:transcriptional regulator [Streptococcus pneumoniae]